jgi:hypothetical protein
VEFFGDLRDSLDFTPRILTGDLLIVMEVREAGERVQIDFHSAATADGSPPALLDGGLAPDQALVAVERWGRLDGSNGPVSRVGPSGLRFPILAAVDATALLYPAHARLEPLMDGTAAGVVGGGISNEDAIAIAVAIDPETIPEAVARSVVEAQADLQSPAGECARFSGGWTFTAVPARLTR